MPASKIRVPLTPPGNPKSSSSRHPVEFTGMAAVTSRQPVVTDDDDDERSDAGFNSIWGSDVESEPDQSEFEDLPSLPGPSTHRVRHVEPVMTGAWPPEDGGGRVHHREPEPPSNAQQHPAYARCSVPKPKAANAMCIVCGVEPKHSNGVKTYDTCSVPCAERLSSSRSHSRSLEHDNPPKPTHRPKKSHSAFPQANGATHNDSSQLMCAVCHARPRRTDEATMVTYPTCGRTCADRLSNRASHSPGPSHGPPQGYTHRARGAPGIPARSPHSRAPRPSRPRCVVCGIRPTCSNGDKHYSTCGITCADQLKPKCVICGLRPIYTKGRKHYPTCGLKCAEQLVNGGAPSTMCNYCHRNPKLQNYQQCGAKCRDKARKACLLCRSRPRNGKYHFCGRFCRVTATKASPLLLEAHSGHMTFRMVENKFKQSWKATTPCPNVKKVYKVVESTSFLAPYDVYRQTHGNECFRYHGTKRACALGDEGHTKLCNLPGCSACSILRTSFNVSLANRGGAFGPGIYTSSAPNKSAGYANGIMFLTKVVLGKVHYVNAFASVTACPAGSNSVIFDRMNGSLNETIVYTNDAIRPVFLIVFG